MSDSATPGTVARQALLSMELYRQDSWSGLPFPIPGDLPNAGIELMSLASPELADGFFTNCVTWEVVYQTQHLNQVMYNVFICVYTDVLSRYMLMSHCKAKK